MQASSHSNNAHHAPSHSDDADAREFERFIAGQNPREAAAAGWMIRRQDGLSPAEEAELEEWLRADPANAEELQALEDMWGRMDELPQEGVDALKAGSPSSASVTAPVAAPVDTPVFAPKFVPQPSPVRSSWLEHLTQFLPRLAPQLAVLGLVAVLVGGGWMGWQTWQQQPTFTQSFATLRGQQKEVHLPDGSTLWLDTATQADVTLYRNRREVRLPEGQAQFAVQSDAGKPFHVYAGSVRVTVVGTKFTVRHTSSGLEQGRVSVSVSEGRVRVAQAGDLRGDLREGSELAQDSANAAELTAGQVIATNASGELGAPAIASSDNNAAWREGRVSFNNVPLAQVLAEFERYGPTKMVVRDPQVAALRVHGSFDLRRLDAFATALPQVLAVRFKPTGDGGSEIVRASSP